jgi:hypothetical protein
MFFQNLTSRAHSVASYHDCASLNRPVRQRDSKAPCRFNKFNLQVKGIILEVFTYKFKPCTTLGILEVEHALRAHVISLCSVSIS